MKKTIYFIASLVLFLNSISVNAQNVDLDETSNHFNQFADNVYNSNYYEEYEERIEDLIVEKVVVSDEGIRSTMSFELKSDSLLNTTLVFIGDENGTIIEALLVVQSNDLFTIENLIMKYSTNISTRGPVYLCDKYVCTKTGINFEWDGACNAIVGSPCSVLNLLGSPIYSVLCKAGVIFACGVQTNACLEYTYYQDVCSL